MTEITDELLAAPPPRAASGQAGERWRLDKSVPIGVIVVLIIQLLLGGGAIVWWTAHVDGRIAALDRWTQENTGIERRLTRIETTLGILVCKGQPGCMARGE